MVCLFVKLSSFYLAPFLSYFDGSFHDRHTQTHTRYYTVTLTRFLLRKSSRLKWWTGSIALGDIQIDMFLSHCKMETQCE